MKKLSQLLNKLQIAGCDIGGDPDILSVAYDSRKVLAGSLFFCIKGATVDGHDFARTAVQQGAVAVIAERELPDLGVPVIVTADIRRAMQIIVPYFLDYPTAHMKLIGVTGTNGKTTTTNIIYNILKNAGHRVGLIGTIETKYGDKRIGSKNTTPDIIDLQYLLYDMYQAGTEYVVMEVSSHALALERTAGCFFDAAVLTNITQDHLDFHQTFDNYVQAKALLFANLNSSGKLNTLAVINKDDPSAEYIAKVSTADTALAYAIESEAQVRPLEYRLHLDAMTLIMATPQGELSCHVATTGLFNVYNIMAATAVTIHLGVALKTIKETLDNFHPVDGRFELVKAGQDFSVIVDYAHTPDGLENVLKTARQIATGRVIAVFGCGGNRDKTKRPIMAGIAEELADIVVITSDNPRKEDPLQIIADVEAGIRHRDKTNYITVADRATAIEYAIKKARKDDVVLIAGKGHETYQILNTGTIDFDDRLVAKNILRELGYAKT